MLQNAVSLCPGSSRVIPLLSPRLLRHESAGETPKQGAPLYLASDNTLTKTSGTQFVGTAWADAQANDATVLCRINFGYGVAAAAAAAAAAAEQGS